jgi:hypothetical protein
MMQKLSWRAVPNLPQPGKSDKVDDEILKKT